jgi:hypothetical protein
VQEFAEIPPHVVQNYFTPFHQDRAVLTFCHQHRIQFQAYSSLSKEALTHPLITVYTRALFAIYTYISPANSLYFSFVIINHTLLFVEETSSKVSEICCSDNFTLADSRENRCNPQIQQPATHCIVSSLLCLFTLPLSLSHTHTHTHTKHIQYPTFWLNM